MLGQCQHANNDVLPTTPNNQQPTTPTITQHWPDDCLQYGLLPAERSFQRNIHVKYENASTHCSQQD